MNNRLTKPAT